jgi:3-oxoacyl-[acyl-carrier protein] reductase
MVKTLKDKVALVTGGSGGIGAAVALRLAKDGAAVAIAYSASEDAAERTVRQIREAGGTADAFNADARKPAETRAAGAAVAKRFGRIDILVNHAGVSAVAPLSETTDAEFDRLVDIDLRAAFAAAGAATKAMGEGGRIINIGSVLGESVPWPGSNFYAMTEFAVAGLPRGWARDLAAKGITINAIQPGPIATDMNADSGDFADSLKKSVALGRYGRPEEVAELRPSSPAPAPPT